MPLSATICIDAICLTLLFGPVIYEVRHGIKLKKSLKKQSHEEEQTPE